MTNPLVILGFGRSGTTWVADIISRATGRLVLFEPIHPSVMNDCDQIAYRRIMPGTLEAVRLAGTYRQILRKELCKPWLLRNHVGAPLRDVPPSVIEQVWSESQILGMKEIRGNFMAPFLKEHLGARIMFIVRDPRAVVASIIKRKNFWEFGWPGTYELLLNNTVRNPDLGGHPIVGLRRLAETAVTDVERVAVMWAITHVIALDDALKLHIPVVCYEDLYMTPAFEARRMFNDLGLADVTVRAEHLAQPSVTTEKSLSGLYESHSADNGRELDFFWNRTLMPAEAARVLEIADDFGATGFASTTRYSALPHAEKQSA